jgi:hypothetical protein
MDLTELIEAFFAAKQRTLASNTRCAYRYDLMACAQVLQTLPVREITVSHLRLFLDATTDLAPTTLARRKAALRSCFRWAYQQDLMPADPTAKLEAIPIGERDPRPLNEEQVEAILAAIPRQELRNRLLFTLLYETGMRVGEAHTAKHLWELGLAEQMRKLLRSSDLSIPGNRQHKVWTSYLHTPTAWAERKASWFTRLPASENADTYLDLLQERYRTTLKTVLDGWENNDFAEMVTKDGKATLDLSKDENLLIPATVEPLREALLRVMPHARLTDVLIEVDDWVGLRSLFTHLNERESAKTRDPRVDVALFAALLAHGLNLPLSTMAEATDIPYHELTHVSDWYLREETLRRPIRPYSIECIRSALTHSLLELHLFPLLL